MDVRAGFRLSIRGAIISWLVYLEDSSQNMHILAHDTCKNKSFSVGSDVAPYRLKAGNALTTVE